MDWKIIFIIEMHNNYFDWNRLENNFYYRNAFKLF